MAAGTPGLLPALHLAPADEQERAQAGKLAEEAQAVVNESVKACSAGQGCTGGFPARAAKEAGIGLTAVKLPEEAETGFTLPPKRRAAERGMGC